MLRLERPTRPSTIDELIEPSVQSQLSRLDLASRKVFSGKLKGERRSKKRGESVEFADHRPYVLGDDLRHIDWSIYARMDRFFMKLFLEEEDLSLHLVIDASASGDCGEPSKFLYMQKVAAALGYVGLINLNRVACTALSGHVRTGTPADVDLDTQPIDPVGGAIRDLRGRRRIHDLGRFLCSLEPAGPTDFGTAAKRIALSRRGRGVMVVLSDFFMKEGYEQGLRMLVGRGYDVVAIQVLSPQEVEPEGPHGVTGDLRLRDAEDADLADVTISAPLLKKYKANLSAYCSQLREFCARREITCLTVRSDTPIETLLLDYLRRRGLLR